MTRHGLGWLPDYPDFRDYTSIHPIIAPLLDKMAGGAAREAVAPTAVDLREWCPPIENQGNMGSCTAQAGVALVEYFERRAFGKHVEASRLFLYKVTRNLLRWTGDTGGFLRTTMGALVLFGIPPEDYWPYDAEKMDKEPPAFCYAFAQNYQAISYFRLDPPGVSGERLLEAIKGYLAAGLPAMFGFTVYSSVAEAEKSGRIPFPDPGEKVLGGHAVMVAGYDDGIEIPGAGKDAPAVRGAFLIRNSWGTAWGEDGYGWLPYEYVRRGLAEDWWSMLKAEWADTGMFGL